MDFRGKEHRAKCYEARDAYFDCLENSQLKDKEAAKKACSKKFDSFESTCGKKWTEHFIRRQDYLKFKAKLEQEGYEAIDQDKLGKWPAK